MRILALESSGMAGSVAALEDDSLLTEVWLDPVRRTAQTLVPAIHDVLQQANWDPSAVQLVAVTTGPGSFTGLRIGVTTAKTFAYATGAAVVGVNTLSVIARTVFTAEVSVTGNPLWVVLNAEREQLFAAAFDRDGLDWSVAQSTRIIDHQAWIHGLRAGATVAGPGLDGLLERIPVGVQIAPQSTWTVRASDVGREGLRAFRAGKSADCWSLMPDYFRESAAVEKAEASKRPS